ncbi:carbohydrate kinase family protein [soil metagenome]
MLSSGSVCPKAERLNSPVVAVSGSIAYDHIMSFGGSFGDHIIPEKTHVISLSFLVDSLKKQRGGVAGNVCYSLALLGSPSLLIGAAGEDFDSYAETFTALGIDLTYVLRATDTLTASAFMMADQKDNHIASFFPGPASRATAIDVLPIGNRCSYAIVGATAPEVMTQHVAQFGASAARLIFDPAFQIILLTPEELVVGMQHSWGIVSNDYEFAMIERKTGLSVSNIAEKVELVVVTYGEKGSELISGGSSVRVPAAPIDTVVDPTGAGDAYRSGLIKGLLLGPDLQITGRIAGLTAAYAVEHVGTQAHEYTIPEFKERFDQSFPDYAGAINEIDFHSESMPLTLSHQ